METGLCYFCFGQIKWLGWMTVWHIKKEIGHLGLEGTGNSFMVYPLAGIGSSNPLTERDSECLEKWTSGRIC